MSEADPREPDDLGPRLRDLAKSQVAPADALDRLRDRLRTNIPALGPTPPVPSPPPLAAGAGAGKLLFAVAGLLVGAAAGAIVMHEIDRSAPATLAAPTVTSAQESSVRTAPTTTVSAAPTASATPRPSAKPLTTVDPAVAPSAVSANNAERLLVDEARAAYARGARNDALDALSRHATRYPNGALVEEREALAVRILVDAGRTAEARTRGERFRARYPKSLMLPAVEAALESIP